MAACPETIKRGIFVNVAADVTSAVEGGILPPGMNDG
jgi:hypothetical protein